MNGENSEKPSCFGKLDCVFPLTESGLRSVPKNCMACELKTECLRFAMSKGGALNLREERIDSAYASGRIGFFQRWSEKKEIYKKLKDTSRIRK